MGARGQGAGETLAIDVALIRQREALGRELRPKVREALPSAQPKLAIFEDNAIEPLQGPEGIAGAPEGEKLWPAPTTRRTPELWDAASQRCTACSEGRGVSSASGNCWAPTSSPRPLPGPSPSGDGPSFHDFLGVILNPKPVVEIHRGIAVGNAETEPIPEGQRTPIPKAQHPVLIPRKEIARPGKIEHRG